MPRSGGLIGHPRFFSLEGLDGSGKTTQLSLLARSLESRGHRVATVREPGGTAVSDRIRQLLLAPENAITPSADLLLFSAARAQLVAEVISPALEDGRIVLADRFGWSTLAYQGYGRGMDRTQISRLFEIACGPVWPIHSFLLDLPVEAMRERLAAGGRAADRMESENALFFERVRSGYLSVAREYSEKFTVLDAAQPAEAVHAAIRDSIDRMLPA